MPYMRHDGYPITIEQQGDILGMGIALQGVARDGSQYDEGYLNDIMDHIQRLTRELRFTPEDQATVTRGFTIDSRGNYGYAHHEPLLAHLPAVITAYQRLTDLTLGR